MPGPDVAADDSDRRELYEHLLDYMRARVHDINSRLLALSAAIDLDRTQVAAETREPANLATGEPVAVPVAAHQAGEDDLPDVSGANLQP